VIALRGLGRDILRRFALKKLMEFKSRWRFVNFHHISGPKTLSKLLEEKGTKNLADKSLLSHIYLTLLSFVETHASSLSSLFEPPLHRRKVRNLFV